MSHIEFSDPAADAREKLAAALRQHRAGDLPGAEAGYRALLAQDAGNADALNLLGLIAHAQGDTVQALACLEAAVARSPSPRHLANLAMVLCGEERFAEAEAACARALAQRPAYAEALNTRGVALAGQGRLEPAVAAYRGALALRPEYAEARLNLANLLARLLRCAEAETEFRALLPRPVPAEAGMRRALFVAADGDMPGREYRSRRMAEAARWGGWEASSLPLAEVEDRHLAGLAALIFWRVELDPRVCRMIAYARAGGARVGLDVDDLIVDPALARLDVIDGIRTLGTTEAATRRHFVRMQEMLEAVDFCTCTTRELARHLRGAGKPVWVLPNGFDEAGWRRARQAVRRRRQSPADGRVRIGYAGGTRTHQADFAVAAPALVRVMQARPQALLVLFRDSRAGPGLAGRGLVDLGEFPDLARLRRQIEWRDMVTLAALPEELARFDINIAPLQVGNPFVEAKSELKYFEAALAGVATVASPAGPFRRAIRHGVTGLLASDGDAWEACLNRLIDDPALRARIAASAYRDALWRFGPVRRAQLVAAMLEQLAGGEAAARQFRSATMAAEAPPAAEIPPTDTLFGADDGGESAVTVTVASCNYDRFIIEALDSVAAQTLADLDLVVVDDASTDESAARALAWAERHRSRFHRVAVLRTWANAGLGANRNAGFAWAETPFVLPLDADNRLRPGCVERLLAAAQAARAAFAYPSLQSLGASDAVLVAERFEPQRLIGGNYIDAMALVAKWAWAAAGGYYVDRAAMGWEDYDLWCSLAELGLHGVPVPEVLADYRVHEAAMTGRMVETTQHKKSLVALLERRHPWLDIFSREAAPRGLGGQSAAGPIISRSSA